MGSIAGVMLFFFLLALLVLAIIAAGVALFATSMGLLYRGARPAATRVGPSQGSAAVTRPASAGRRVLLVVGGFLALALSVSCLSPFAAIGVQYLPRFVSYLRRLAVEDREKAILDPALEDVRRFVAAERAYQARKGGSFGTPECLARPQDCIPEYVGPPFIDAATAALGTRGGFVWTFHPAPRAGEAGVSRSRLSGYALLGVRAEPFEGARSVCGDAHGPNEPIHVCAFPGRELDRPGVCPASCIWHSFSDRR